MTRIVNWESKEMLEKYIRAQRIQNKAYFNSDLDRECAEEYGQGWRYDPDMKLCVYIGGESLMRLPKRWGIRLPGR